MTIHACTTKCRTLASEIINSLNGPGELQGVAAFPQLWDKKTLRVSFLEGDSESRNMVIKYAKDWEEFSGIEFDFGSFSSSDIRITFDESDGSWSKVGTKATQEPQDKPTMNFGWVEKGVIRHEFGHALGLKHEHQHPEANIPWDTKVVYEFYMNKKVDPWTKEEVDRNIFKGLQIESTYYFPYDKESVMHYPFPKEFTGGKYEMPYNTEISKGDQEAMAALYLDESSLIKLISSKWHRFPVGTANDIGIGADGSVWIIGTGAVSGGYGIWRWKGKSDWQQVDGGAVRIAVDPEGRPWIVNSKGSIFRRLNNKWQLLPGTARDIGISADGSLWVIGTGSVGGSYGIWRWNGYGWNAFDGGAVAISVDPKGIPWVVNSEGSIFRRG
jgi:hypothetical protein